MNLSIPLANLCISQYTSCAHLLYFRSRVRWSTITSSVWTVLECPFGTLVERWHRCTQHPSIHGNHICQAIVLPMTCDLTCVRCSGKSPSLTPPPDTPSYTHQRCGQTTAAPNQGDTSESERASIGLHCCHMCSCPAPTYCPAPPCPLLTAPPCPSERSAGTVRETTT